MPRDDEKRSGKSIGLGGISIGSTGIEGMHVVVYACAPEDRLVGKCGWCVQE